MNGGMLNTPMKKYKIVMLFFQHCDHPGEFLLGFSQSLTALFEFSLSVPLFMEYESVAKRNKDQLRLSGSVIDDILDYLPEIGNKREIYFYSGRFLGGQKMA